MNDSSSFPPYGNLPKTHRQSGASPQSSQPEEASQDILSVQASTNLGIAQANEARHRQLLGQEQILQSLNRQLEVRTLNLQHREDQVILREQEVATQRAAADATLSLSQQQKDSALADRQLADEHRKKAEEHEAKSREMKAQAEADLVIAKISREEADAKLKQAEAGMVWPQALQGDVWRTWRLDLMGRAQADPRAALVLARLQVLSALMRSPESDKQILEALAALGQSVCLLDPQKAWELAAALTNGSQGAFEIAIPRANENVDKVWMRSPPATTKVAKVVGWCVKDNQGVVQFHAQVE